MSNHQEFKKNSSGYSDPTAFEAVKNIDADTARFQKLLNTIFYICELAGFHIEERIVIRDLKTGKIYR
jgi:hypothetical protein